MIDILNHDLYRILKILIHGLILDFNQDFQNFSTKILNHYFLIYLKEFLKNLSLLNYINH